MATLTDGILGTYIAFWPPRMPEGVAEGCLSEPSRAAGCLMGDEPGSRGCSELLLPLRLGIYTTLVRGGTAEKHSRAWQHGRPAAGSSRARRSEVYVPICSVMGRHEFQRVPFLRGQTVLRKRVEDA